MLEIFQIFGPKVDALAIAKADPLKKEDLLKAKKDALKKRASQIVSKLKILQILGLETDDTRVVDIVDWCLARKLAADEASMAGQLDRRKGTFGSEEEQAVNVVGTAVTTRIDGEISNLIQLAPSEEQRDRYHRIQGVMSSLLSAATHGNDRTVAEGRYDLRQRLDLALKRPEIVDFCKREITRAA